MQRPEDFRAGHQGRLLGAGVRQHQFGQFFGAGGVTPGAGQRQAHGQRAAHGPQVAAQGQFAGELIAFKLAGVDLAAGRQDAQGDRQVKTLGVLLTVN